MIFFTKKRPIYRPHHYTLYELTPNYISQDGLTHHNSYGFRGQEFEINKPPNTYRIVCMGESTTYCVGIKKDADSYPNCLEKYLRKSLPKKNIEVLNAGVGGYTSAENLLRFIFKVHPLNPDLIVFYYTHNDVHARRFPSLSRDYKEYSKSWCEKIQVRGIYRKLYYLFIEYFRPSSTSIGFKVRRNFEYYDRTSPDNILPNTCKHFKANMECFALLAKSWGIKVLFVNPPYCFIEGDDYDLDNIHPASRAVHEHRLVIAELARKTEFHVYDLKKEMPYPPYTNRNEWRSEHHLDKTHVNEKGADLMGKLIAKIIFKYGYIRGKTE